MFALQNEKFLHRFQLNTLKFKSLKIECHRQFEYTFKIKTLEFKTFSQFIFKACIENSYGKSGWLRKMFFNGENIVFILEIGLLSFKISYFVENITFSNNIIEMA